MRKWTKIVLVLFGGLLGLMFVGGYLLTTDFGYTLYLTIFRPNDPRLMPDSIFLDKAEQMDEVRKFHSTYPNRTGEVFRGGEPYLVGYRALNDPRPFGSPLPNPPDRAVLILSINQSVVVENVTFGCSYGENNTYAGRGFTVSGENVMRYFNDVELEKCWNAPPPQYRDPPEQSPFASTQPVD